MTATLMTEHQTRVAHAVLDEESTRRWHLVVSLSGAHAYGFPSPDSDLDLKCIHVTPTAQLLRQKQVNSVVYTATCSTPSFGIARCAEAEFRREAKTLTARDSVGSSAKGARSQYVERD